ncbi:hypothetical protein, partial [Mycobacterium intracellulare]|uniref:hypothetical protein n=3 Tax=Mycobacterium intracellulare TaxID=1767 RepID=UPI000446F0C6
VHLGIERVEHRVDIGQTSGTHTAKLSRPTDKKPRIVTTETTVTQGISLYVSDIRNRARGAGKGRRLA